MPRAILPQRRIDQTVQWLRDVVMPEGRSSDFDFSCNFPTAECGENIAAHFGVHLAAQNAGAVFTATEGGTDPGPCECVRNDDALSASLK